MMPTITRDADLCIKCGTCVMTCPESVYVQESKGSIPEVIDIGSCISCGHCVSICPKNAIVHSEFPEGQVASINTENIPSSEEVLELLRTRRSIRVFKERPVESQLIEEIIEAARFAPSSENSQTTEFIVVQDKELLENIARAVGKVSVDLLAKLRSPLIRRIFSIMARIPAGYMNEYMLPYLEHVVAEVQKGGNPFLYDAPALILFHAEQKPLSTADINATLALYNVTLIAHAQGLGSCYTGYIMLICGRDKTIPQMVKLPKNHKVYGALAIGYPRFEFKRWPERKKPRITWL